MPCHFTPCWPIQATPATPQRSAQHRLAPSLPHSISPLFTPPYPTPSYLSPPVRSRCLCRWCYLLLTSYDLLSCCRWRRMAGSTQPPQLHSFNTPMVALTLTAAVATLASYPTCVVPLHLPPTNCSRLTNCSCRIKCSCRIECSCRIKCSCRR